MKPQPSSISLSPSGSRVGALRVDADSGVIGLAAWSICWPISSVCAERVLGQDVRSQRCELRIDWQEAIGSVTVRAGQSLSRDVARFGASAVRQRIDATSRLVHTDVDDVLDATWLIEHDDARLLYVRCALLSRLGIGPGCALPPSASATRV